MKNTVLALLAVMLVCSCSKQPESQTYDNPEIGLRMTYPGTWQVVKKEALHDALNEAEEKLTLSQETMDAAKEMAPSVILTLAKPQKVDGVTRNPNINVVVIPIPEEQWSDIDLDVLLQEQIADIRLSIPGSEVTANVFPLPDYPAIHNYLTRISLPDRMVTQYQYAYWRSPHFIQIVFTSTHADDEQELKGIITSMKIKK